MPVELSLIYITDFFSPRPNVMKESCPQFKNLSNKFG